ncbi:tRNA (cytidine(34)-2'-O)-methyltransferase [Candidatus Xianfuyuplasma coldseepsis]|uniref:Putative tRNA (cytidine(34)-2'-O)-methyltransferase n=1 Tax=Candidatus Xianfuyuplasma coldseepsis TaxID=2782163 RepID=A0A7L7KVA7_9MOLU|nr:tRNA (cytidine(34)-2'-O)-methyltransferase [Xianfuyuplasma coldseepsis]QMS85698.1 tRNA (cytidine(34)-2'-O)-methyltransferase [Xianfuyuplasma coldseepsis]
MNHIVLYHPEIPQNTGNIMRTCAATNMHLHLIEPLGFKLDTKYVKRSAANYLEHVDYTVYKNWEEFIEKNTGTLFFLTRYGQTSPDAMDYTIDEDVFLVFGAESSGIPKDILQGHLDRCLRLPMTDKVRSLNLSNTVAIVAYEVLRQQGYKGLYSHEPDSMKGKDYLQK